MRTFIVIVVCITACVAAPNGYGVVRQSSSSSYAAPAPIRVLTTTAAPLVLRNSYATYEQPAFVSKHSPIVSYDLDTDNRGTYRLATVTADQSTFNQEGNLKDLPGAEGPVQVMRGSYSFVGEDNKTYTVNYVADENGFRAEGAHIPTPHPQIQQALMMTGPGSY